MNSKPSNSGKRGRHVPATDAETNRRAAIVLEVLAGVRTPTEAASALAISVNYYYVLERKAVGGLLSACRPTPKGPGGPSMETQLQQLQRQLAQCRNECQRQTALVRATQRAIGLPSSAANKSSKKEAGKTKGRRRRKPTVRALKAAATLRQNSPNSSSEKPGVELERTARSSSKPGPSSSVKQESSNGTMRQEATGRSSG